MHPRSEQLVKRPWPALRKDKRHRLIIGVHLIQQAAAVEIDVNDVMPV